MPTFNVRSERNFQSSLKYALISFWKFQWRLFRIRGLVTSAVFWALTTPNAWLITFTDPARLYRRFFARVALVADRPVNPTLESRTAALFVPAPNDTCGV